MLDYVVVAEDDTDDVEFIKEILSNIAFHLPVYFVENGVQLIEHLNACPDLLPRLIIINMNMPKISGYEVLEYMQSTNSLMEVDVVVFSTSDNDADKRRCLKAGAKDYIIKSSRFEEMIKLFERIRNEVQLAAKSQSTKPYQS